MQTILDSIVYHIRFIYLFFKNGFKIKTALFYPRRPSSKASLVRILKYLNYNISWNPKVKYDIAINWEDVTFRSRDEVLTKLTKESKVINADCTDISKQYVGEIFEDIFGYPILIDPLTYNAECLKKNNLNAHKEKTRIVKCPVDDLEEGYVYTLLIDSKTEHGFYVDYRVSIVGNDIPLILYKKKAPESRFLSPYYDVSMVEPTDHFTDEEIAKTKSFCKSIGLDMGELDVLRNQVDGKMYIVDANNTPWGPLRGLKGPIVDKALEILSNSFEQEFLDGKEISN
ncbi:hypothetical protein ACFLR4_04855 [Bacteroidota bacterium]